MTIRTKSTLVDGMVDRCMQQKNANSLEMEGWEISIGIATQKKVEFNVCIQTTLINTSRKTD
jgi:hypothetical protein